MFQIDDTVKEFVESGVAVLIGTGDSEACPHAAYGWGPRVRADRVSIDVFLDEARSERTLANLRANGRIAMTMTHPVSYRSLQLKGTFRESGAPDEADRDWVRQQREGFVASAALVGDPPAVIRNLWLEDVVRITFAVEHAFNQTPGAAAGAPL